MVRAAAWTKPEAPFRERRVKDRRTSGQKIGWSFWSRACWISRSITVGIPNGRVPLPPGLGISTRRTGGGWYVPLRRLPNTRELLARQRLKIVDGHSVDARRSAVANHALVRCDQVLTSQHLIHERQSLVPGCPRSAGTLDARMLGPAAVPPPPSKGRCDMSAVIAASLSFIEDRVRFGSFCSALHRVQSGYYGLCRLPPHGRTPALPG